MPEWVVARLARVGGEGADHVVAEPGLAAQHAGDLVDVALGAGDHHALLQGAVGGGRGGALRRSRQRPSTSTGMPIRKARTKKPRESWNWTR